MQNGEIKVSQLSSSSDFTKYHTAARGRLGLTPDQSGKNKDDIHFKFFNAFLKSFIIKNRERKGIIGKNGISILTIMHIFVIRPSRCMVCR